jgi:hypothetical protein
MEISQSFEASPICTVRHRRIPKEFFNNLLNLDTFNFAFVFKTAQITIPVRLELAMGGSVSPLSLMPLLVLVRHS